jgi:hypothetical protein
LGKFCEKIGKIREKGKRDFGGIFRIFGSRRNFRDSGDGEAGRPAGPQRAQDSRRGGRQWRWGSTRWATARVRAVPVGFAARAPRVREGEVDWGFEGNNCAPRESLKTHVIW